MFLFVGGIETGVTTINETKWAAWIMMGTLSPYIIAQAPRVLGLQTAGNLFILIAAVIAIASLLGYCLYQVGRSHIVKFVHLGVSCTMHLSIRFKFIDRVCTRL